MNTPIEWFRKNTKTQHDRENFVSYCFFFAIVLGCLIVVFLIYPPLVVYSILFGACIYAGYRLMARINRWISEGESGYRD